MIPFVPVFLEIGSQKIEILIENGLRRGVKLGRQIRPFFVSLQFQERKFLQEAFELLGRKKIMGEYFFFPLWLFWGGG